MIKSSEIIPIHIVTDFFNDLDKETCETKNFTVKYLARYRKDLIDNFDVVLNPENKQQLIAVSGGRLLSMTLLPGNISWADIDDYIEHC